MADLDFHELEFATFTIAFRHGEIASFVVMHCAKMANVTEQSLAKFGSNSLDSLTHNMGNS